MKNIPLLFAMLIIGCSTLIIALNTHSPEFIKITLLIASAVLNVWSMMGLILHLGIQKLIKN
ncbi:MAG: hypothetical protein ABF649_08760 [Bacillus sp. (in: firmicutes)]